ncbi:MAG: universal stress protein [Gammaproteobacteria bacterium]|nr:MAG: universal stress protein [Gammaproteobacteria bacterium]
MYQNILTYVDMHKKNSWIKSLPHCVELIKRPETRLHILTCLPDFGMPIVAQFFPSNFDDKKVQQEILKQLQDFIKTHVPAQIKTKAIITEGTRRDAILNIAKKIEADLIVLPTAREKSHFYTLGATAAHVVRHADCSVLIVR